jgi:hypothetical protein
MPGLQAKCPRPLWRLSPGLVVAAKKADAITIKQGPLAAPSRPRSCRDVALSLNSVHCENSDVQG